MPAINFPASPSVNDTFTASGKTWKWNGTFWELVISGASVADGSVSTAKIADSAITNPKLASGAVHSVNIASGAVTAAKLGNDIQLTPPDGSITTAKVAANAITQAKLAANVTGITLTTTANRSTDIPSPFTAQFIFLTDTNMLQRWSGSAWTNVLASPPGAPTSLSATVLSTTSVSVAFTPGASAGASTTNYKYALSTDGGVAYSEPTAVDPADFTSPITISGLTTGTTYYIKLKAVTDVGDSDFSTPTSILVATPPAAPTSLSASAVVGGASITFTPGTNNGSSITNYQYALSTNGGSTYGSFTALDPADATSPITITGLTGGTTYTIKLKAVNALGAGAESTSVSVTPPVLTVDYLVVAGGGGGATYDPAVGYAPGGQGGNSVFSTITSLGGGGGKGANGAAGHAYANGGCGGGGAYSASAGGTGTTGQGYDGGTGNSSANYGGGGGGGAGANGASFSGSNAGNGGAGVAVAITGSSVTYAGGGGGSATYGTGGSGGSGGGGAGRGSGAGSGTPGTANTGGGGGAGEAGMGAGEGGGGGGGLRSTVTATGRGGALETALTLNVATNYAVQVGAAGAGTGGTYVGAAGGSGVVILRYNSGFTITVGAGLTASHTNADAGGGNRYTRLTAGSGNVSWS